MNYSPILIVAGEPNSVFLEIFFKVMKKNKILSPLILITSHKLLRMQMKKLKFKKKIKILDPLSLDKYKLDNKSINLINVKYNPGKTFEKISTKSNKFIEGSFELAFKIIKKYKIFKFINGPISKKNFFFKKLFFEIGPLIILKILYFLIILKANSNESSINLLDFVEIFSKALLGLYSTFIKFIDLLSSIYLSKNNGSNNLIFFLNFNFLICIFNSLLDVIRIRGLKIIFFFKTLKKISKKILLGSPATIKIGL